MPHPELVTCNPQWFPCKLYGGFPMESNGKTSSWGRSKLCEALSPSSDGVRRSFGTLNASTRASLIAGHVYSAFWRLLGQPILNQIKKAFFSLLFYQITMIPVTNFLQLLLSCSSVLAPLLLNDVGECRYGSNVCSATKYNHVCASSPHPVIVTLADLIWCRLIFFPTTQGLATCDLDEIRRLPWIVTWTAS